MRAFKHAGGTDKGLYGDEAIQHMANLYNDMKMYRGYLAVMIRRDGGKVIFTPDDLKILDEELAMGHINRNNGDVEIRTAEPVVEIPIMDPMEHKIVLVPDDREKDS